MLEHPITERITGEDKGIDRQAESSFCRGTGATAGLGGAALQASRGEASSCHVENGALLDFGDRSWKREAGSRVGRDL